MIEHRSINSIHSFSFLVVFYLILPKVCFSNAFFFFGVCMCVCVELQIGFKGESGKQRVILIDPGSHDS